MADKPFSSCCGIYWVKYKQSRQDLHRFVGRAGRPPYTEAQKARYEQLKKSAAKAKEVFDAHQADATLTHGYTAPAGPK